MERTREEPPRAFGEVWAIDFASEWLENGRQARIVGVLDVATRENLLLKTQPSIRASHLVKDLEWLFLVHGKPRKIRFDNGPEFRSRKLVSFLEQQARRLASSSPALLGRTATSKASSASSGTRL